MSNKKTQGASDALNKFYQKELDELNPKVKKKSRNAKPEKDVEAACLAFMRAWGWTVEIYEAKATWDPIRQIWKNSAMKAGTCDCMGTTEDGVAVAVEFKAPGRLSSFNAEDRYLQRKFIVDRINSNAFACVVDSSESLRVIYGRWKDLRAQGMGVAREYLLSALPQKRTRDCKDVLFEE